MNTEDIQIFLCICEKQSISSAASALLQTQSAVSRRLAVLEKELQVKLFNRGRGINTVQLTAAGEQFLPLALQICSLAEEAGRICRLSSKQKLRIAAPDSVVAYRLSRFFADLMLEKKDWELDISMEASATICEMVRNRSIDVGIINGDSPFSDLDAIELYSEPYVVVTENPAFLGKEFLHPNDLDPFHEVYHTFGEEFGRWHSYWFPDGRAKAKVNLAHVAVELLQAPEDWTILARSVAQTLLPDGFSIYPLQPSPNDRKAVILTQRTHLPGQQATIAEFKKQLFDWLEHQSAGVGSRNPHASL